VAYGFNPPSINAGYEIRVPDQVIIQRSFLHDLPPDGFAFSERQSDLEDLDRVELEFRV
jgi:hypothetical protein